MSIPPNNVLYDQFTLAVFEKLSLIFPTPLELNAWDIMFSIIPKDEEKTEIWRALEMSGPAIKVLARDGFLTYSDARPDEVCYTGVQLTKKGREMYRENGGKKENIQPIQHIATQVIQNIHGNAAVRAGVVQGFAQVNSTQNVYKNKIDIDSVKNFLTQEKSEFAKLPESILADAIKRVEIIDKEFEKYEPDHSVVRSSLNHLKTICEGAASNLTAQGIISFISKISSA